MELWKESFSQAIFLRVTFDTDQNPRDMIADIFPHALSRYYRILSQTSLTDGIYIILFDEYDLSFPLQVTNQLLSFCGTTREHRNIMTIVHMWESTDIQIFQIHFKNIKLNFLI